MAEPGAVASNEDGWRFCSVCKRNHEEGRKHIFTKKHVNKLKILMEKFLKKARSARRCLSHPQVYSGELEPGARVWCHCCEEEVDKHVTDGRVSIEWAGLIEHMTKPTHHKRTRHYWWEHGAETRHLQSFLLFPAEYQRYKESVARAMEDLEKSREDRVKKLADNVRVVEQKQAAIASEPPISCQPPRPIKTHSDVSVAHHSRQAPSSSAQPLLTLSTIKPQGGHSGRGNVHTGATPPWLRDDDEEEEGTVIGPSEEEFIKHRERLRHAGKNPKRVGADFHLKLALQRHRGEKEDDNWLPSFGRVWNPGPRSHTKSEFHKEVAQETKRQKLAPSSSSVHVSTPPALTTHSPTPHTSFTSHTTHLRATHTLTTHTPTPSTLLNHLPQTQNSTATSEISESIKPYVRKRKISSLDQSKVLSTDVQQSSGSELASDRSGGIDSGQDVEPYIHVHVQGRERYVKP